ncbi:PAS domain S-box protein [Roseococcus sp. SYP-B2431]|uniref:hybrid sensor histidine kinase/response regulator n=1 Tax=Roseococcus sp. SYP-B2431 TaxID=2496640 RepID=UPI00103AB0B2|nr:PAS domain S-box protein [Roseococcus sp. SYP-B2431]TCH99103.1 PAS domain S-box protein [Roseococcus sp. SYP-B2431]
MSDIPTPERHPDIPSRRRQELAALGGPWLEALTASAVAIVLTDALLPDDPILHVNPAFEALTGYPAAEALGRNCRFLQPEPAETEARARIREALATDAPVTADLLNRRRDGERFWNRISIATIRDGHGAPAFRLATQADVSSEYADDPAARELRASRRSLAEVQERLRVVQSVAGAAGAWEWDIASKRLVADARFASIYGLDAATAASGLPTAAFFAAVHEEDRMRLRIAVAGALHGAEVFARDYRVVVDGEIRWVAARGRTYLDAAERPLRFAGVLTDITDQRKVEERLHIAQTAGEVGSFEYVAGYGTAEVSEQFCRLLGLRPAQSLPVRTINALVHPEDPALIQNRDGRISSGTASHEFRITRADTGEERWLASRGEYRAGLAGGTIFTGVIYDITTTKRSEAALRLLTEKLEERVEERTQERDRLWNLSRDLLNVIGPDGRLRAVNPAWTRLLGHDEAELIGTSIEALTHPEDAATARSHLAHLLHGEAIAEFDIRMRTKGGDPRWVSWTVVPEGGAIYGIGRDVTQRKLLEDQLRQSQKMEAVGQLTGGIAHDFNNMLTGILGGIDMVRRRVSQGRLDDVDRFLEAAMQSGQRAAALTHRLLAFSRRQTLDSRPLDVAVLVRSIEDLLRRTLGEQIELVIDMGPDLWSAVADDNQLESAILNLAINSRDAMPDGGRLTIGGRNVHLSATDLAHSDRGEAGDYVEIRVADTGLGMPADVLAKAFDPFYTTKPQGQGTGLGLSMVYGFIQQSRGDVMIESREGSGTTIRLFLPRHHGAPDETPAKPRAAALPGTGETVLVIEDDPAVRLLVLQVLQELGYRAIETADERDAVPILQSARHLDLLISDVGLPGMSGRRLAEIARASRPGLPVLFMTGYAREAADQAQFLDAGMEIITKPFAVDELGQRVNRILRTKGMAGPSSE